VSELRVREAKNPRRSAPDEQRASQRGTEPSEQKALRLARQAPILERMANDPQAPSLAAHQLRGLQATHGNQHVHRLVDDMARLRPRELDETATTVAVAAKSRPASIQRKQGGSLLPGEELHLDPDIKAKMQAMQAALEELDPAKTKPGLLSLPLSVEPPPPWLAPLKPEELAGEKPLVKAGAGPAKPRAATGEDLLKALVATGVFDPLLTKLREKAKRDFRRLKPGEKALLITTSAVISAGAIAGIVSDSQARRFALDQLDGLSPEVPGVPGLSLKLNTAGGRLGAMFIYEKRF